MTDADRKAPCPFCGADAMMFSQKYPDVTLWAIRCNGKGCWTLHEGYVKAQDAVARWNTRALSRAEGAPREPTLQMIEAGDYVSPLDADCLRIWYAMWDAAPSQPAPIDWEAVKIICDALEGSLNEYDYPEDAIIRERASIEILRRQAKAALPTRAPDERE